MSGGFFSRIARAARVAKRAYFAAAETNRLTKNRRSPMRLHPNTPVTMDGAKMRATLRQMGRDNPIVSGARRSFKTNVLPSPILVEPDVKRPGQFKPTAAMNRNWNDPADALWKLWCETGCDWFGWASHHDSFGTMQIKLVAALFFDGEMFAVKRRRSAAPGILPKFQVELVLSDRLDETQGLKSHGFSTLDGRRPGIEYDEQGRPVAYWFTRHSGGIMFDSERVPASDVIHVIVPNEPGEHVGEMPAAPVINPMGWIGEIMTSEFSIRAIMGKVAGVITGTDYDGGATDEVDSNGTGFRQLDFEDGTLLQMGEGEFKEFDMNRPGASWEMLVQTFLRWISAGLGIPYSILASDFRGLNYSVSKAERDAHRSFVDFWRENIIASQFVSRVYRDFINASIAEGLLAIPGTTSVAALTAHRVRLPKTMFIDPLKDIQADVARMRAGESPQSVFGERGLDFYEEVEATAEAFDFVNALRGGQGLPHLTIFTPEPGTVASDNAATVAEEEKTQEEEMKKDDEANRNRGRRHVA